MSSITYLEWEAPEAQARIQSTIDFLLKGWNCKKGKLVDVERRRVFLGLGACAKGALIYSNDDLELKLKDR